MKMTFALNAEVANEEEATDLLKKLMLADTRVEWGNTYDPSECKNLVPREENHGD